MAKRPGRTIQEPPPRRAIVPDARLTLEEFIGLL